MSTRHVTPIQGAAAALMLVGFMAGRAVRVGVRALRTRLATKEN